jgi:hypothetical protein
MLLSQLGVEKEARVGASKEGTTGAIATAANRPMRADLRSIFFMILDSWSR